MISKDDTQPERLPRRKAPSERLSNLPLGVLLQSGEETGYTVRHMCAKQTVESVHSFKGDKVDQFWDTSCSNLLSSSLIITQVLFSKSTPSEKGRESAL